MVVGKVEEELLYAEEGVDFGEDLKLGHFSDEPADLQLGFDVDLILLSDMPSKILKLNWLNFVQMETNIHPFPHFSFLT